MQNITGQLSQNSSDEQLIKSLKGLCAIALDDQWKRQEKARIFATINSAVEERKRAPSFLSAIDLVFRPLPAGVFAVAVSMLTGGFAVTVFLSGGFQPAPLENFSWLAIPQQINIASIFHNDKSSDAVRQTEGTGSAEGTAPESDDINIQPRIALHSGASSSSRAKTSPSSSTSAQLDSVDNPVLSQSLGSLKLYGDDTATAFRTFLREWLNRLWVLAQESGNEAVLSIADEAEKFYGEGDYDAVLRAVSAAEALLE